ncbi:MAG: hypothetical protein ACFFBD_29525 [Candidatus Hodarchaeota archaeon]
MSKAVSYYDWELQCRKKSQFDDILKIKDNIPNKKLNSLGINEEEYKSVMKKWRENNLK